MGSRLKREELAYIAGFLDGDGSLMLQIKRRSDTNVGLRLMFTICFYQDTRHDKPLKWIRNKIGIGYFSSRSDGISELRINGYRQTKEILQKLLPYIRFKKTQAKIIIRIARMLMKNKRLNKKQIMTIAKAIEKIQRENYQSPHKKTKSKIYKLLGLTPYRLSFKKQDSV